MYGLSFAQLSERILGSYEIARNGTLILAGKQKDDDRGVLTMSEEKKTLAPKIVAAIMLMAVFLLPYGYQETFGLGSANHFLRWPFWSYLDSFYYTGFELIQAQEMLEYAPFWILRLALVYSIYRYYSGEGSRKQVVGVGIISELPPLILTLPGYLLSVTQPSPFSSIVLPIPALLALAILILYLRPREAADQAW
jgi:hypothetical protein